MVKNRKILFLLNLVLLAIVITIQDYGLDKSLFTNRWYLATDEAVWAGYGWFLCWWGQQIAKDKKKRK